MKKPAARHVRQRRRGPRLEAELLGSAWAELVAVGFQNLTMESVAARAATGVAVLYRRWANKAELVLAAIAHYRAHHPVALPDTGSLRGDLLAALTGMGIVRAEYFLTIFSVAHAGLLSDMAMTPSQMRDQILGKERIRRIRSIFERAHARGEIHILALPEALLVLPFDLVRHDLLMGLKPLKPARIRFIVDEIVMPLVQAKRT